MEAEIARHAQRVAEINALLEEEAKLHANNLKRIAAEEQEAQRVALAKQAEVVAAAPKAAVKAAKSAKKVSFKEGVAPKKVVGEPVKLPAKGPKKTGAGGAKAPPKAKGPGMIPNKASPAKEKSAVGKKMPAPALGSPAKAPPPLQASERVGAAPKTPVAAPKTPIAASKGPGKVVTPSSVKQMKKVAAEPKAAEQPAAAAAVQKWSVASVEQTTKAAPTKGLAAARFAAATQV